MGQDRERQAAFDAAVRDMGAALAPLIGRHDPVVVAVALAATLGGMTDALHKNGVLRPTLAGSLSVVNGWVASGVHGSMAGRGAMQGQAGHA